MKKDAYYFSHDANAQDDPKMLHLIDELGMEGYGIFWALIERMRSQCDFMLTHTTALRYAKRWNADENIVKRVITEFDLFVINGDNFYSNRLKRSMEEKSEKARVSASYRWNNANAIQTQSKRNANDMRNDAIKVKERKKSKKENDFSDIDSGEFTPPPPGMVF